MKRFIELWLSNFRWARKLHGGRWVSMQGCDWVTWNDYGDTWPPTQNDIGFVCEEYLKF